MNMFFTFATAGAPNFARLPVYPSSSIEVTGCAVWNATARRLLGTSIFPYATKCLHLRFLKNLWTVLGHV
jgi:hypothetical protein